MHKPHGYPAWGHPSCFRPAQLFPGPCQVWLGVCMCVCTSNYYFSAAVVGPELMEKPLVETERVLSLQPARALNGYRCLVTLQMSLIVNVQKVVGSCCRPVLVQGFLSAGSWAHGFVCSWQCCPDLLIHRSFVLLGVGCQMFLLPSC